MVRIFSNQTPLACWLALVTIVTMAVATPATAQSDLDPEVIRDRVEQAVERTSEILEQVGPRIEESQSPRAIHLFHQARELQQMAIQGLQEGVDAANPAIVRAFAQEILGLTLKARDLAQRAAQIAHEEVSLQERAARLIEQADNTWDRLRDLAEEMDRARAILQEARRQIETARQHFADYQFEIAMKLAQSALHLMAPLRDAAGSDVRPDRLEHQLQRLADALERAASHRDQMNDAQLRRLSQAQELYRKAVENFEAGNLAIAHRMAQRVQNMLQDLRDGHVGQVGSDDVDRALRRFDLEADRVRDLLAEAGDARDAQRLLDRALDARQNAVESSADERFQQALTHLRAGLDLLSRARRLLGAR